MRRSDRDGRFAVLRRVLRLHQLLPVVALFAVAVAVTSLWLRQYWIALLELILGVVLSVIVYIGERRTYTELENTVSVLNDALSGAGEDKIAHIPLPLAVTDSTGAILWYNEGFRQDVVGQNGLTTRQIARFLPPEHYVNETGAVLQVVFGGRFYTVYTTRTDAQAGIYALYFVDNTYYKQTEQLYRESRPVVFVISADALDEVSATTDSGEYSALMGDVEQLVYDWFRDMNCTVKRTGDCKFFGICEIRQLAAMEADGFTVLNRVRAHKTVSGGEGLTLSIGVGCAETIAQSERLARQSADMAKGRGGDQVVLCREGVYEFIGGVAVGAQSRSRVQARRTAASIESILREAHAVYIMGHRGSDLDAIGSAMGLAQASIAMGKPAKIVLDEATTLAKPLVQYVRTSSFADVFMSPQAALDAFGENDLLIVTDVMRGVITDSPELVAKAKRIVVVDHHRMSVDRIEGALIFYHDPNASSACELTAELLRYMSADIKPTKVVAEAMLSGIYLDTKDFTLRTGVRTFEAAAYLREFGADTVTVRKLFAATGADNAVVNAMVNAAVIDQGFAVACTEKPNPNIRVLSSRAADELLKLEGVDASFVIYPIDERTIGVSARSYGKVNVQIIMEKLGGGGHHTMAAAQLYDITMRDALDRVIDAVGVNRQLFEKSGQEDA